MKHFKILIFDLNITHQRGKEIDWALCDNNIELLDVCPNFLYFEKTLKLINNFLNIKKIRSQIMNHMRYIYIYIQ